MALRKTLGELRAALRDNLDEQTPGFFTDAMLTRFLNRAKDRVWTEVRKADQDYFALTRTSLDGPALTILGQSYDAGSFQIRPGVRDYTLPPDLADLRDIRCLTSGFEDTPFVWMAATDPRFRVGLALPDPVAPGGGFGYTLLGERTLRLRTLSDTTLDLQITYVAILPDLADASDTLEMPHGLSRAVEEYAAAAALKSDRDPNAAAWEASGNSTVAAFLATAGRDGTGVTHVAGYLEDW